MSQPFLVISLILGFFTSIIVLWYLPKYQSKSLSIWDPKERAKLEDAFRKTISQILGGGIVIIGLIFTWLEIEQRQEIALSNTEIVQEGQITDRFIRAVEQLGSDKLTVRIGGIYALGRIAQYSPPDYQTITEILTSFVRENAGINPVSGEKLDTSKSASNQKPSKADIQAVITFLGRPEIAKMRGNKLRLELQLSDLSKLRIGKSDLSRSILARCNFYDSYLRGANLQKVDLGRADLREADLREVDLRGAYLGGTDFRNANLGGAQLDGADLTEANFTGAIWTDGRKCGDNSIGICK